MIVAALMAAALRYADKPANEPNNVEMHQLSRSLAPVAKLIPESATVGCDLRGVKTEVFLWTRYLLAPRYVPYKPDVLPDTSLVICPVASNDSSLQAYTADKTILWSGKDSLYHYFLTRNR
jgi:hypothetical protein